MLPTALRLSHELLQEVVTSGDTVLDGTIGNGHDTLFLAQLVGKTGQVYGFDVQEKALLSTKSRLEEHEAYEQTQLFLTGHEHLDSVIPSEQQIKGAIFNLGYLPCSDKSVVTKGETTIQALKALCPKLERKGRILLVVYYGHPGGENEKDSVWDFCQTLEQSTYTVASYQFINQKNQPPLLICIEKK
ncbi:class I SAM-dependent methyltransferase [Vagococcus humatus]|uniref:SAM-dependent methyltransferase n=1 Tax=Vagococcus humatus TaxID=1889241 RepID=A0A3S0GD00_9ENTE|nr:class I SAM-dependent methyltransferase [Vagococcus humatus]RST89007.1 SAM-dependent methyltransferase [Vagococcus humatus]